MFNYVHHVHYAVENIDQIAVYLEKHFGLKPIGVAEPPGWGFKALLYKIGPTLLDFSEPLRDERGEAIVQRSVATKLVKRLKESGPGLTHVAWGVSGLDQAFEDLKGTGLKFAEGEHGSAVHQSVVGGYNVLNIDPAVGPVLNKKFQLAEGEVIPMPGWRPI